MATLEATLEATLNATMKTRGPSNRQRQRPLQKHVVIIGNGIAGVTAARFVRKASDARITIVSGESDFHYSRTALMYIFMGHMRFEDTKPYEDWFWQKNRIQLVRGWVGNVDVGAKRLTISGGRHLDYDDLVIAVGSKPNRFGWPGDDLPGVQGLYSLQDLDLLETSTRCIRRATVVGGGLIGVELAEMLHSRGIDVTFLVRESSYMDYLLAREESEMVNREAARHGIDLRLATEVESIQSGSTGRVEAVVTRGGDKIPTQFVGLTLGVRPNTAFLTESGIDLNRGVLVNEYFETNVANVYAVGDCAEFRTGGIGHRSIEQLWYTGRAHGKFVARTLCGARTAYDRGVFFNSAKFFGLEYQTYGVVDAVRPDHLDDTLLRSIDGSRLLRVRYERENGSVTGFNGMGVRLRHSECEAALVKSESIRAVEQRIEDFLFDPEFAATLSSLHAPAGAVA